MKRPDSSLCQNCSAYLKRDGYDGREIGETGILPCGCAYCWHCDDNRGRAEDHDLNCTGPVAHGVARRRA